MPPKAKVCKEDIRMAAVAIVQEQGADGLNARSVAARLGCSTQPVFSNYAGMEELKADVIAYAGGLCRQYMQREMTSGEYPAYKASGMAYIRFAKEEPEFFKLLFMRSRTGEETAAGVGEIAPIVEIIQKNTGLSYEMASLLHLEMWVFVHGIATMLVTSYLSWDWELISTVLTDVYMSLRDRYMKKE